MRPSSTSGDWQKPILTLKFPSHNKEHYRLGVLYFTNFRVKHYFIEKSCSTLKFAKHEIPNITTHAKNREARKTPSQIHTMTANCASFYQITHVVIFEHIKFLFLWSHYYGGQCVLVHTYVFFLLFQKEDSFSDDLFSSLRNKTVPKVGVHLSNTFVEN